MEMETLWNELRGATVIERRAMRNIWVHHLGWNESERDKQMPAINVDDLSAIGRITSVEGQEMTDQRAVTVTDAPKMLEGAGFGVRRAFAGINLRLYRPIHSLRPFGPG